MVAAAPALLGWHVVRGDLRARIVETEAYRGNDDPACHAYNKVKMKNMALFGPPGRSYIYFTYGNHWMLNVSAHADGDAAGILIRAAEPLTGLETFRERRLKARRDEDLLSGPGKLAAAFDIDSSDNDIDLFEPSSELRFEPPDSLVTTILSGPRVGIAVGKAHERPWRFADGDRLRWVSRPLTF